MANDREPTHMANAREPIPEDGSGLGNRPTGNGPGRA